jgi:hypothetical protein
MMNIAAQDNVSRAGIQPLSFDEIESVSGGLTLNPFVAGASAATGGVLAARYGAQLGATFGAAGGPIGFAVGAVAGAVGGFSIYYMAMAIADM